MPFSFPQNPTLGQQSTQNGRTYRWSGYAWEIATPVAAAVSNADTVDLIYSSTITTDASVAGIFNVLLTGNATLANPVNADDGKTVRWRIKQDSVGGRSLTLGDKFSIPAAVPSPLPFSTLANKTDLLAATYDATRDRWDVVAFIYGY